jgi:hypothetical protein
MTAYGLVLGMSCQLSGARCDWVVAGRGVGVGVGVGVG